MIKRPAELVNGFAGSCVSVSLIGFRFNHYGRWLVVCVEKCHQIAKRCSSDDVVHIFDTCFQLVSI